MAMRARTTDLEKIYTIEEFERLPEFSQGYELLDWLLVKKPMANIQHGRVARRIMNAYYVFDPNEKIGEMAGGDVNIRVEEGYAPAPDISFWKVEHRPTDVPGAAPLPDLVVEVWSPSDTVSNAAINQARRKILRYLRAGVSIAWAINLKDKTVEVYHSGRTSPTRVLTEEGILDSEFVIPGFKIPVVELFV
jgi:Uma2 family endonuclease